MLFRSRTSLENVWAGGDCTYGGQDLTVEAVEHGKIEQWVLKVKNSEKASELANILTNNKSST